MDQIVVSDGFGFDKAALEIGVDDAGGLGRGVAGVDGPGADFFFAGGEIGAQAEQVISRADQRADAAFLDAELLEEGFGFGRFEVDEFAFDLRADDDGFAGRWVLTYSRTFWT